MKKILFFTVVIALSSGCSSFKNQKSMGDTAHTLGNLEPFTEVYVEYIAPESKWMGPSALLVHIDTTQGTKDTDQAKITVTPQTASAEIQKRAPASVLGQAVSTVPVGSGVFGAPQDTLTNQEAREKIQNLAASLEAGTSPFTGCMYPVKLKLVRADGAVTESLGCRGQVGWVTMASGLVADAIGK